MLLIKYLHKGALIAHTKPFFLESPHFTELFNKDFLQIIEIKQPLC